MYESQSCNLQRERERERERAVVELLVCGWARKQCPTGWPLSLDGRHSQSASEVAGREGGRARKREEMRDRKRERGGRKREREREKLNHEGKYMYIHNQNTHQSYTSGTRE